jgi:MYXO-CTERM domain-containing protein
MALWLLAGALVIAPSARAAPHRTPTPSAEELWKTYPLRPGAEPTRDPAPREEAVRSAARASVRPASARMPSATDGGPPLPLIGAAAALAALAASALLRRRRSPRAGGDHALGLPLITAAAATAAMSGRRQSPRLTTLTGAGDDDPVEALAPPDPERRWTAELEWHDEAGGPRFHVIARAEDGGPAARIASSERLEWPPPDAVAVQRLRRTVARIEAAVRDAGWAPLPAGETWYAKRFAWAPLVAPAGEPEPEPVAPPAPVAAATPAPAPRPVRPLFAPQRAWPADTEDLWRCEIRWRAGYINSRFTLVARRPAERRPTPLASSQTFKWMIMNDPEPASQDFRDAVMQLDEQITDAGWEPVGSGREWWELRYVWRGAGDPPLQLDPAAARVSDADGDDDAR